MPLEHDTSVRPIIEIDGTERPDLASSLVAASVEHGLDRPARATLAFALPPPLEGDAATAIVETARCAAVLRLTLPAPAKALFSGTIVQVTHDVATDQPPRLEVTAVDALARLERVNPTVVYRDTTPTAIIEAVAARNGLQVTSEVDDGPSRAQTVQAGETDLAFVERLAAALDATLLADGAQLRLVRRSAATPAEQRLVLGESLQRLRVTADATAVPRRLAVEGWSPDTREPVSAVQTTPELPRLPAFEADPATTGTVHLHDPALLDQPAAAARLQEVHGRSRRRLVTASGLARGPLPLAPGAALMLVGVGRHAAGDYTIDWLTRTFDHAAGWQTSFTASRATPDPSRRETPHADRDPGTPARPAPVRRPDAPPTRPVPARPVPSRRPGR